MDVMGRNDNALPATPAMFAFHDLPHHPRLRYRPLGGDVPRDGVRASRRAVPRSLRAAAGRSAGRADPASTCPKAKAFAWPMVVRTAVMDEIILRAISRDGVRTVVNLAAGLDARAYRLELPRELHWIDVDLPGDADLQAGGAGGRDAALRARMDPRRPRRRGRSGARCWRASRRAPRRRWSITEGLLIYLEPDQVAALAPRPARLRAAPLVADRPRVAATHQDDGADLGRDAARRRRPVQVRARPRARRSSSRRAGARRSSGPTWDESLRLNRTMRFAGFWSPDRPTVPQEDPGSVPADGGDRAA